MHEHWRCVLSCFAVYPRSDTGLPKNETAIAEGMPTVMRQSGSGEEGAASLVRPRSAPATPLSRFRGCSGRNSGACRADACHPSLTMASDRNRLLCGDRLDSRAAMRLTAMGQSIDGDHGRTAGGRFQRRGDSEALHGGSCAPANIPRDPLHWAHPARDRYHAPQSGRPPQTAPGRCLG